MADQPNPNHDRDLLRRFEPIVCYNRGERFFPMDVEPYVRECSLWVQRKGEAPQLLIPEKTTTLDDLAQPRADGFDAVYFMQFIEPLNVAEMAAYNLRRTLRRRKDPIDTFVAGRGRLARVGYGSRLVDALFSLTLLARGRVPGDTAAAAALVYRHIMEHDPHTRYYGRIVRNNDWIVLQYWFFYPYNNWRSGFFGVNDHESDWEQICIYLYDDPSQGVTPEWIAYASHDFSGDDLRRRWDDPEVDKDGEHPLIYAGAGSHASYFQPGEYLAEIELPFLRPLVRLVDRVQKMRQRAAEQYYGVALQDQLGETDVNVFRIPFVDYARGDGHRIGPGQAREWDEPGLLDPVPGWAVGYRGLWGLYARDPLSGEDAPAGPMYNRDGSVRKAWYDPLGWAGLDKVPAPHRALEEVYNRRAELLDRQADLGQSIDETNDELVRVGVAAEAMRGQPHLKSLYTERQRRIADLTDELNGARAERAQNDALLEALDTHAGRLQAGDRGLMRAHIQHAHEPIDDDGLRVSRIAEFWAAASIGLGIIALVLLIIFQREALVGGAIGLAALFIVIEAGFRRWLGQLITAITLILAAVAAVVLLIEFFWPVMIAILLLIGGFILWENLREFFS